MLSTPNNLMGYDLLHAGTLALGQIERNGIRVDRPYCIGQQEDLKNIVKNLYNKIIASKEGVQWKEHFGKETNLNSGTQLDTILHEVLKLKAKTFTASGKNATDESALMKYVNKVSFIEDYLMMKKLDKAQSTYFKNFLNESFMDGYLHPSFDLNTALTYRSSSSNPNFQNIPIRSELIGPMLRKAIIPRPGRMLLEADYSGIEVRGAACYHKDPNMISYIEDKTKDMHRDMGLQIYKVDHITKPIRQAAKNSFVFPSFYGSYYVQCAKALWERIETDPLKTAEGVCLYDHLKTKGIKNYRDFENHLKIIEQDFWSNRFPVYNDWKKEWYQEYLDNGFFNSLTGFTYQGYMKKNDVINYPVQGSSFHCLLWSVIHVQQELEYRNMESLVIGQIHDSIIMDVIPEELNDVMHILRDVMTKQIRKVWDWIIVPLEIEVDAAPINKTWSSKKQIHKFACEGCYSCYGYEKKDEQGKYMECILCGEQERMAV